MAEFTHFNESGRARMVDVSAKAQTERVATAQAKVYLQPETLEKIQRGKIAKGDVLAVAQVAGVMGAKKTPDLIPMCHPLLVTSVDISFKEESQPDREGRCSITVSATAKTTGQTGIEMEAMQMAKTSAAVAKLGEAKLPLICLLADPTFGGVTASIAMLGDVIIAEPKALIGFAGPRVIEQTIKQQLPDQFQRAEFLLEHGMIDMIVERKQLKETLSTLVAHF